MSTTNSVDMAVSRWQHTYSKEVENSPPLKKNECSSFWPCLLPAVSVEKKWRLYTSHVENQLLEPKRFYKSR